MWRWTTAGLRKKVDRSHGCEGDAEEEEMTKVKAARMMTMSFTLRLDHLLGLKFNAKF